jgi:hypothetical protein
MVKSQGVEAYLVRYEDKHRYPEHAPLPTQEGVLDLFTMAYVEIVTGERYEIFVVFTADFNFKSLPDVKIIWSVDKNHCHSFLSSQKLQDSIQTKGQYERGVSCIPALVDGKWMNCGLSFADLQLGMSLLTVFLWLRGWSNTDEDAEPTADQVLNDVDSIGQVKIFFICGVKGAEINHPYTDYVAVTASSKDVVKKNHVSHSTR